MWGDMERSRRCVKDDWFWRGMAGRTVAAMYWLIGTTNTRSSARRARDTADHVSSGSLFHLPKQIEPRAQPKPIETSEGCRARREGVGERGGRGAAVNLLNRRAWG
jgi:hypothetical protein